MQKKQYSLPTAIAMIIGIVIGSGIFFKADDILFYTSGNVVLGVIIFAVAAISIVFGCLTISQLAFRTEKAGGIITYMEENWSKASAGTVGWFHTFVYYPSLTAVIAWVAAIYISSLFGLNASLETQMIIGFVCMVALFVMNGVSAKLGGILQVSSTVIKLIPLFSIAIFGLIFGDPVAIVSSSAKTIGSVPMAWIGAIAPIAFSFDGWIVSTSIAHEIKNSKRNLPIALILSPLFVLIAYVLYFVGVTAFVGPEKVMALGDDYLFIASKAILGNFGAKIVLIFIVISVLGTVNGLILGHVRLPYSLALRKNFPMSEKMTIMNEKSQIPTYSAYFAFFISALWFGVHYLTMKYSLLPNSDVSEISIITNYLIFIALYIAVLKLAKKGEIKNKFFGFVCPVLAIIGSLIIFSAAFSNLLMFAYIGFSAVVMLFAYIYCKQISN